MHCSEKKGVEVGYQDQASNVWSSGAKHRWGVVLAGGDGTRLQPLTRLACGDNRPKQFCPLLGGETLLTHTRQRIAGTVEPDRVLFVLTKKHEPFYKEELKYIPWAQKIVQPRNQELSLRFSGPCCTSFTQIGMHWSPFFPRITTSQMKTGSFPPSSESSRPLTQSAIQWFFSAPPPSARKRNTAGLSLRVL